MDIEVIKEELTAEGYLKRRHKKNKNEKSFRNPINTVLQMAH